MQTDFKKYLNIQNVDKVIFVSLILFISILIFNNSIINIHFDDADHFLMLKTFKDRVDNFSSQQIFSNLNTVENNLASNFPYYRFPGYSMVGIFPSYILDFFFKYDGSLEENGNLCNNIWEWDVTNFSEFIFKTFILKQNAFNVNCNILLSLLIVSYVSFFVGIYFCVKILYLFKDKYVFLSIIPILILSLPIFIHNILITPLYSTLFSFGLISAFVYYFFKELNKDLSKINLFLPGLILGILSMTRIEGFLLLVLIILFYKYYKTNLDLTLLLKGFFSSITLFFIYNFIIFKNPFEFGFLNNSFNYFAIDFWYIFDSTINPASGILFYSSLLLIGIFALYKHPNKNVKLFFIFSLFFILTFLLRLSVLHNCGEDGYVVVDFIEYECFGLSEELTKFDNNRYLLLLFPFSLIGLNYLVNLIIIKIKKKKFN